MVSRSLLYNSVTVSLPKNMVQFLLGVVLFWLVNGSLNFVVMMIAMAAFLTAYSSVYFFNDIVDSEEDRKDSEKKEWKLVASGKISKKGAAILGTVFLLTGISLSAMVNGWFLMIMISLVFLNFLHSSPYTRLKKRISATSINLTVIEFLKYSSGWFALTSDLRFFPFWIVMCFSLVYSILYVVYKSDMKRKTITEKKWVLFPLGVASIFSYVISVFLYNFALSMIILFAVSFVLTMLSIGKRLKFTNWLFLELFMLPVFVIAFLMLTIPPIAEANDNITITIDQYKQDIYRNLPDSVAENLKNLTEPRYASLEELQEAINSSINLSGLGIFEPPKD